MKLLLDTHTFIWFIGKHPKISLTARKLIQDPSNQSFLSMVSIWEIAIKVSIGKLQLKENTTFEDIFPKQFIAGGFHLLNIQMNHTSSVTKLPFHHNDPFDRLLVAQSIVENMPLVSNDSTLDAYPITRLW